MIKSVMVDGVEAVKMMVDGTVAWERGGLPAGYRKCKYLHSDGNQYISVDDYTPEIGDSFSIDFVRLNNDMETVVSAGTGKYQFIILTSNFNQYVYMKYFTTGSASYTFCTVRENPYNVRISGDGQIVFDGMIIDSEVPKDKQPVNTNLHLFIRANLKQPFCGKILGFCAERNCETIRNLVPALRISDGKPGMLDTVTENFYMNQGT